MFRCCQFPVPSFSVQTRLKTCDTRMAACLDASQFSASARNVVVALSAQYTPWAAVKPVTDAAQLTGLGTYSFSSQVIPGYLQSFSCLYVTAHLKELKQVQKAERLLGMKVSVTAAVNSEIAADRPQLIDFQLSAQPPIASMTWSMQPV